MSGNKQVSKIFLRGCGRILEALKTEKQSAKIREANIRKGNSGQAEKKKSGKVERKGIPQQSHKLQKIPV